MILSMLQRQRSLKADEPKSHVLRDPVRDHAFRFVRHFSIISFVCIACSAVSMVLYFRHVSIQEIAEFGEYSNTLLAEVSLSNVRLPTLEFLRQTQTVQRDQLATVSRPADLDHELSELRQTRPVERVKIYNKKGWVVYSSKSDLIGDDQSDNLGVQAALAGKVTSELIFRDSFNVFDHKSEEDNLIQTYVPIRLSADEPVMGVFEIYVDVNPRVLHSEQTQVQVMVVALFVMGLLYLVLMAFVRWAEGIMDQQQRQIRSHAQTLEVLSARMLQNQEDEKRLIAFDLHEGLAQTLSAVKMNVEAACHQISALTPDRPSAMQPMVHAVKEAIAEVRAMALKLRPASLDDLGLTATIHGHCRDYGQRHPDLRIEARIALDDAHVPKPLRVIVYRVLEETCRAFESQTEIRRIRVALWLDEDRICLDLEHDGRAALSAQDDPTLEAPRERTLLSGGNFYLSRSTLGGTLVRISWLV